MSDYVVGDGPHISQVLINLLSNAVKFTGEGGVVKLSISAEVQDDDEDDVEVNFVVSDTGIGMSQNLMRRLFEPFEQAPHPPQIAREGTGLGLSIAKRLINLMGGTLSVQSEVDKGSVFSFSLQMQPDLGGRSVVDRFVRRYAGATILKIGNNTSKASINLSDYLQFLGATIIKCDDCRDKDLKQLLEQNRQKEGKIDVVVFDHALQAIEEKEAIKQLTHLYNPENIVVVTSGEDGDVVKKYAESLGIKQVLNRPLMPKKMIQAIEDILAYTEDQMKKRSIPDFTGGRILVVEDIDINRRVLQHFLKGTNVVIDEAENGQIAVDLFEKHGDTYDVVFMDVQMPVMNGYDATIAIREMEKRTGRHVPIYAMTASAYGADIRKCISVGMDAHISKPYYKEQVLEVVAQSLYQSERHQKLAVSDAARQPEKFAMPTNNGYINWRYGLERFASDRKLYTDMLLKFKESAAVTLRQVNNLWQTGDKNELLGVLHTQKGASKDLVLTRLSDQLAEVESKLFADRATNEDIKLLIETINETFAEIESANF